MLARRLTTILPAMTLAEAIETTCIHRVAGLTGVASAYEPLANRLKLLQPATIELEPWEEVADPAGGDLPEYVACAQELDRLIERLATLA